MSQYKITKKRLAEIIKEEYESIMAQEAKKPDFLDLDKDGNKEEKEDKEGDKDKGKKKDLSKVPPQLRKSMKKESLESIRDLIKKELGNL